MQQISQAVTAYMQSFTGGSSSALGASPNSITV